MFYNYFKCDFKGYKLAGGIISDLIRDHFELQCVLKFLSVLR